MMSSSSPPPPPAPPASLSHPIVDVVSTSPRYLHWLCLIPPSLIALGSTIEAVRMERYVALRSTADAAVVVSPATSTTTTSTSNSYPDRDVAVISISCVFLLSLLYVASMYAPSALSSSSTSRSASSWLRRRTTFRRVVETTSKTSTNRIELAFILVVVSLSIASLHACTNPATGLAVNANGGIGFGNLYYSTWITALSSLWLLTSYVRVEYGFDVHYELTSRGRRFRCWTVLVKSSIAVMGSAASCYDARCMHYYDDDDYDYDGGDGVERWHLLGSAEYCRRAAYGVASGCVGSAIGLAVVSSRLACAPSSSSSSGSGGMTTTSNTGGIVYAIECASGTSLAILYAFAVAYLTGEEGPGAPLGNLYYSTWITFGLSLYVCGSCLEEVRRASSSASTASRGDAGGGRGKTTSIEGGADGGGTDAYADDPYGSTSDHGWGASDADASGVVGASVRSNAGDDRSRRDHRAGMGYAFTSSTSSSYFTDASSMRSGSVGEVQVGV
jgi:hypothetical protein